MVEIFFRKVLKEFKIILNKLFVGFHCDALDADKEFFEERGNVLKVHYNNLY